MSKKNIKNDKQKEIKQDNNKKGSKFITFVIILVIVGIAIGSIFSPVFNLSEIIVVSGENVSRAEILETFSLENEVNVFKINCKEIKESVEKLAYIKKATVSRKLPNKLEITYIEREPYALIKYLESYLVMDKYGYILEIQRENKFPNLPILYNIEFESYEIGKQLTDTAKTKYDNVVYLFESALNSEFKYGILEINYESISNVKIWLKEQDIEIIYGEIDRNFVTEKLNYLAAILPNISGKSGKIDISSDNFYEKTVFTENI